MTPMRRDVENLHFKRGTHLWLGFGWSDGLLDNGVRFVDLRSNYDCASSFSKKKIPSFKPRSI